MKTIKIPLLARIITYNAIKRVFWCNLLRKKVTVLFAIGPSSRSKGRKGKSHKFATGFMLNVHKNVLRKGLREATFYYHVITFFSCHHILEIFSPWYLISRIPKP